MVTISNHRQLALEPDLEFWVAHILGEGLLKTSPASHVGHLSSSTLHNLLIDVLNTSLLPIYLIFSAALRHFPESLNFIFLLYTFGFFSTASSVKTKFPIYPSGLATVSPEPGTSISSLCQSPNSLLYPSASGGATPDHLHAPGTPHSNLNLLMLYPLIGT